jgi:hypothetical protein
MHNPLGRPGRLVVTAWALILGLSGCGQSPPSPPNAPSASAQSLPAAAPTPTVAAPYLAFRDAQPPTETIRILDLSGHLQSETKTSTPGAAEVAGAGHRGVYLLSGTGRLSVLAPDGTVTELATIPGATSTAATRVVESPDGSEWAASVVRFATDVSATATTDVYVGGASGTPRHLRTLTRANIVGNQPAGGYAALRWYSGGLLLGSDPTNVGGAGPFISEDYERAVVVVMDPATGRVAQPLPCPPYDVAGDGSAVCLDAAGLSIKGPGGTSTSIPVGTAERVGDVAFVGGSHRLVYFSASADQTTWGPSGWTDSVHVVTVSGSHLDDHVVATGAAWDEVDSAWSWVVDSTTIAFVTGPRDNPTAVLLDVTTGATTPLGRATGMIGVIH